MATSQEEKNKGIIRHAYEDGINRGNIDLHTAAFAPGYVIHFSGFTLDVEAFKAFFYSFKAGFPDLATTVEDVFAEGDKVAARHTYRGTHTGTYQGIPPTGKKVTVAANDLYHMKDGKIVEEWSVLDTFSLLKQIGVIPPNVGPGPRPKS